MSNRDFKHDTRTTLIDSPFVGLRLKSRSSLSVQPALVKSVSVLGGATR